MIDCAYASLTNLVKPTTLSTKGVQSSLTSNVTHPECCVVNLNNLKLINRKNFLPFNITIIITAVRPLLDINLQLIRLVVFWIHRESRL